MQNNFHLSLVKFIIQNLPKSLFLELENCILDAYSEAESVANNLFKYTPSNRPRGQLRRYLADERIAGIAQRELVDVINTKPKGEHFVLLTIGAITVSHIEIENNTLPRAAKHRSLLSYKNSILEPVNYDLFKTTKDHDLRDQLHLVVLSIKPTANNKKQDRPEQIILAIPYSSWNGFHLQISFPELLEHYNDIDQDDFMEQDTAWPKLKQRIIEEEKKLGS